MRHRLLPIIGLVFFLSACGGGGGGNPGPHTVGGTVTGLDPGNTVTLVNNGVETLVQTTNGPFTFATPVAAAYAVTVQSQPYWQRCTVTSGSGTASNAVQTVAVACSLAEARVTKLAGSGGEGNNDGAGSAASFTFPQGLAIAANGDLFVGGRYGSSSNWSQIRKITPSGDVQTWTGGLADWIDGPLAAARFNEPAGLAFGPDGTLFVADYSNYRIRAISPSGVVSTLAGSGVQGWADGVGTQASFFTPMNLAVDRDGNIYVSDFHDHRIRKITPDGTVSTLAGSGREGVADGRGSAAEFSFPMGLVVEPDGHLLVAEWNNDSIRRVSPDGQVTTWVKAAGGQISASLNRPSALARDQRGNVYVSERGSSPEFHGITRISAAGVVTRLAGSTAAIGSIDGIGDQARFNHPMSLAVDPNGVIYVADHEGHLIRKITPVQ